ncbi:TPA: hypothetical protein N0F65_004201 [Lagenidium giganteum]|uniref:non-specific serine/threonine protein kinase n=1 Tax=Lagenidium giganteum TaxID=4803 RepID=A0AAV2YL82_9STRA|nr:TPA: hypothetical protein N0F65_004201 [Lagenidium giganteum]
MDQLTEEQRALFVHGGKLADYEVLKPIGKGKFSLVYKAKQKCNDVTVALKKISIFDLMDTKAREKTLKEVRLVQSVSHDHIVQYLDAFLDNKELYIAFEWAEAGDLKRQIRKANEKGVRFDERTIWRYFSQMCAAILHLHRARIMHRDLKPANIFLTLQGVVKVGDLGLGRHLSEDTMEAHSKVGTPLYMSPEVLRGEGYDWKSDVWSLGCILYELAMLRSPFKSEGLNLYGLFQKINKGEYEPVPDIYSSHLRRLVTRMISLTASDRPSMEEVWQACQTRPTSAALAERKVSLQVTKPAPVKQEVTQPPLEPHNDQQQQTQPQQHQRGNSAEMRVRRVLKQTDQERQQAPSRERHPQEESPRPPSSQSDGGTTGPVSEEEQRDRRLAMRMELLYDKLAMLRYERALHGKRVSRTYFAAPLATTRSKQSNAQFHDMCTLAQWLLTTHLGVQDIELDAKSPVKCAQVLLLAAERGHVESVRQLQAPALVAGHGEEVCELLNALADAVVTQNLRGATVPSYPSDPVEELAPSEDMEVSQRDDFLNDDDDGVGESTASSPFVDADLDFYRWLVVKDEAKLIRYSGDGDGNMIHATVDTMAWAKEHEQLQPRLQEITTIVKQRAASASDALWRSHVELLQREKALLTGKQGCVLDQLGATREIARRERERIEQLEARVNMAWEQATKTFQQQRTALVRHQEQLQVSQSSVNTLLKELQRIDGLAKASAMELRSVQESVNDNSKLLRIKESVRRLGLELQRLEMHTQVLRERLGRYQLDQLYTATGKRVVQ